MGTSSRALWIVLTASFLRMSSGQDASSTLGDFVKQLTSLISQNGGISSLVNAIRPPGAYPGQGVLAAGENGYGLQPQNPDYPQYQTPYPERPGYPPPYPQYAPQYPQGSYRPRPHPPYDRPPYPYPGDYPPGRPEYPENYAPGYDPYRPHPGYPQQSFMAALESITRYDDLRCVPRLLCEVTSGGKPGQPSFGQQQGAKETLTTLLTVLNFVDNNPLFVFGRAALIGAASRGNSAACLNAYPTCPRDADQLVHYLNNHNGGFFRFFGGVPYQQRDSQKEGVPPAEGEARIQNRPARILSFPQAVEAIDYLTPSAHGQGDRIAFPSTAPARGGKHLFFPEDGGHNPGSAYKPDFSPPQNLINFRDQRSLKFPAPMNFPES